MKKVDGQTTIAISWTSTHPLDLRILSSRVDVVFRGGYWEMWYLEVVIVQVYIYIYGSASGNMSLFMAGFNIKGSST